MNFEDEYLRYTIEPSETAVKLSYISKREGYEVATYLFDISAKEPIVLEKLWYKEQLKDKLIGLSSGKYYFLFFLKKKGDKKFSSNIKSGIFNIKILNNYLPEFFEPQNTQSIIEKLLEKDLNTIDFGIIRATKHGTGQVPDGFYNTLVKACFDLVLKNTDARASRSFLLNCIFYIGEAEFLKKNQQRLTLLLIESADISSAKDILFWYGLMMYKLGEYKTAEASFKKLVNYKNQLAYHQTGALSYISDVDKLEYEEFPDIAISYIDKTISSKFKGCILISCDFGYFSAYLKDVLHVFDSKLVIHLHIILPKQEVDVGLEDISKTFKNIFISYEFANESIGNLRTYYSVSRYLILPQILDRYHLPTIVVDADLDFTNADLISVVSTIADNEVALNIKNNDLPWLKVTAGFNVFGRDTGNEVLFEILKKYIMYCFETGRDGWMLDQTALGQCFYFYKIGMIERSSSFQIKKLQLKKTVRQVSNRAKKRVEAKQAVLNLK